MSKMKDNRLGPVGKEPRRVRVEEIRRSMFGAPGPISASRMSPDQLQWMSELCEAYGSKRVAKASVSVNMAERKEPTCSGSYPHVGAQAAASWGYPTVAGSKSRECVVDPDILQMVDETWREQRERPRLRRRGAMSSSSTQGSCPISP